MPYFGRNPVYLGTLAVFVALQPAIIHAKNFQALLAIRFLSGLFGSPVLATGGASIVDMYQPSKRAYAISIWGIAAIMGPVMGPMVGGFAVDAKGWKWTIWEILWLSGFCFVFLFCFLPETSASHIILARTRRLRQIIGDQSPSIKCQPELEGESLTTRETLLMLFIRRFTLSFFEPIVLALNLYIALLYTLIYLWFESFPLVFEGIYGFNGGEMGLAYLGILIGCLLTVPPFWWYLRRVTEPRFINGRLKPEHRLPPAFAFWIVPIIGTIFFTPGAFLLFNSVLNYLGGAYPLHAASVYAGNDLMRSSFGAGFPLFASAMFHRLGVAWASTLLAFLSIVFIPVPFVLVRYGERLRALSRHARHDI
ncbi:Caffeine resistance protein 5 [Talaromyces pinophilus]|nr:Caffeine resistance protein 5 [Talaromyces pinophilus]